jgi:predicted dithiol-disulfide oxidoreductase (DUF899 family)
MVEIDPNKHKPASQEQLLAARKALLAKEKELTRLRDRLSAERRELPWAKIEKQYFFDGPNGKETLADLFEGRSQLIVKHFMMAPGQLEGCEGCSFEVDHIGGALVHLEHHDVSYMVIARAPLNEIDAFKKRMGWSFRWVSSFGSDFDYDFHVSFTPDEVAKGRAFYNYEMREISTEDMSGISVFYKDANGDIFHTYSSYGRGAEELISTYVCLDLTPKGRNETGPNYDLGDWVRHHDKYGDAGKSSDSFCGSAERRESK